MEKVRGQSCEVLRCHEDEMGVMTIAPDRQSAISGVFDVTACVWEEAGKKSDGMDFKGYKH